MIGRLESLRSDTLPYSPFRCRFPAEQWMHIRTTNPIESTFATVRLRTKRTKGSGSRDACGSASSTALLRPIHDLGSLAKAILADSPTHSIKILLLREFPILPEENWAWGPGGGGSALDESE